MITIQLGKKGVTEGFIEEVKRALNDHGKVKINILESALAHKDREGYADDLDEIFDSTKLIGNTVRISE